MSIAALAFLMFSFQAYASAQVADNTVLTQIDENTYEVSVYYASGALMEKGFMQNGESTGKWIRYNEQGDVISEANYLNGKKEGTWLIYNNEGELRYEMVYENNIRVLAKSFSEEGQMVSYRVQ